MKKINKLVTDNLEFFIVGFTALLCILFMTFGKTTPDGYITLDGKNAVVEKYTQEFIDNAKQTLSGMYIKQDSGDSLEQLPQMGTFPYYRINISTPTTFYNTANGIGFDEGFGMQCVAGFKEFMYSLSGKVVATSTGGASGYASQQSQIEPLGFTWYNGKTGLQDGDWGIFGGGQYGHVAMYYQGGWFGQNQGAANPNVGSPFNLLYYGADNLIGYYRPNIYQNVEPIPEPVSPIVTKDTYTVVKGDTLGDIAYKMGWYSGDKMFGDDGYAQALAEYNNIPNRGLIYPNMVIYYTEPRQ